MAWCLHGGPLRWWTDKAGNRYGACRLCEEILVRAGKRQPKKTKEVPKQLTLFPLEK